MSHFTSYVTLAMWNSRDEIARENCRCDIGLSLLWLLIIQTLASRSGHGLKAIQHHFLEVFILASSRSWSQSTWSWSWLVGFGQNRGLANIKYNIVNDICIDICRSWQLLLADTGLCLLKEFTLLLVLNAQNWWSSQTSLIENLTAECESWHLWSWPWNLWSRPSMTWEAFRSLISTRIS